MPRSQRTTLILLALVILFFWAGLTGRPRSLRQPLFHHYHGDIGHRTHIGPWRWNLPLTDPSGVFAFCDPNINLIAVVVTHQPLSGDIEGVSLPLEGTPFSAVLMRGGPHEVRVGRYHNTLLLFDHGQQWSFRVPPGSVARWEDLIRKRYPHSDVTFDLLQTLQEIYDGLDEEKLRRTIEYIKRNGPPVAPTHP